MLKFLLNLFFRDRKNHRYLINNGSVVVVVPAKDGTKMKWSVQVVDISLGGVAFIYEGSPADLAKSGLIKLSEGGAVKFKTISDVESSGRPMFRRRGVQFKWKGLLGKRQIISFINEYGLHAGGREGLRPPGQPAHALGQKSRRTASSVIHA